MYLCGCVCVCVMHSKIARLMVKLFCFFGLDNESVWVSAAVRQKIPQYREMIYDTKLGANGT